VVTGARNFLFRCYSRADIVLSAGAVASPHLLMLSGVGPQEPLRALGLPLVQCLPGVGQNMRHHPNVQVRLRLKPEVPEDDIARRAVRLRYTAAGSSTRNDMILSPASLNTVHATGQDPSHTINCGLYLAVGAGELRLTSADGRVPAGCGYCFETPRAPFAGSPSAGRQGSHPVFNSVCTPPCLLVDMPVPRRLTSSFLAKLLPDLWWRPRWPLPGVRLCAGTQLCPRGIELGCVGLRVVPVAQHPGQFLTFQADHHCAVGGDAAGMVYLPRQKEGDVAGPLDPTLQGFQLGCGPVGFGVRPPPLGLLDGALVHAVDHPGGSMVVGQVVLAGALDAAHQEEPALRMSELGVVVEIVAAKPALGRELDPLLEPPRRAQ